LPNAHTKNTTEMKILEWLYARMDEFGVSRSFSKIAAGTDVSKSTVKTAIDKLEENSLIDVDRDNSPFLYNKTGAGETVLEYSEKTGGVSEDQPNANQDNQIVPSVNVHDFAVEMPLKDNMITRSNRETILNDFDSMRIEGDELCGEWDRFHYRISGEKVIIYLKGEIQSKGLSAIFVKNRAIQELQKCRDWLSDNLNIRFRDDVVVEGRVISQDIAIEDHPITQLADQAGIKLTPDRFQSVDNEGNVRIKLDLSGGETGETESSMRGPESSAARLEEQDVQHLCDDLLRMADNREDWNTLWSYAEDRESIFTALSYLLSEKAQRSTGAESQLQESAEEIKQVGQELKSMKKTQESLEQKLINVEERNNAILSQVAQTLSQIEENTQEAQEREESKERSLTDEFEFTSKWIDNHGNMMGYAKELGRPMKLVDKEELP
jgi:predicted transcriptional regulator